MMIEAIANSTVAGKKNSTSARTGRPVLGTVPQFPERRFAM